MLQEPPKGAADFADRLAFESSPKSFPVAVDGKDGLRGIVLCHGADIRIHVGGNQLLVIVVGGRLGVGAVDLLVFDFLTGIGSGESGRIRPG